MKKLLLAGLAAVAFAGVAEAKTEVCVRPYVSAKATYGKLEMDGRVAGADGITKAAKTDWKWGGAAAVGAKVCAFRGEFEYNQQFGNALDTRGDTQGKQFYRSYMLNGYFDIPTYTPIRPYVGAGVGLARVKSRLAYLADDYVTKRRKTKVAYQLMAGIGYNVTKNWTLDVGYRWVDNGKTAWETTNGKATFDSTAHQLTMGLRYTF